MFGRGKKNKNQPALRTVRIHLKAIMDAMDFLERKQKVISEEESNTLGDVNEVESVIGKLQGQSENILMKVDEFNTQFQDIIRVNADLEHVADKIVDTSEHGNDKMTELIKEIGQKIVILYV